MILRGKLSRWKAAGLHAVLSLGVAVMAAALVFGLWFPHPFRDLAGGTELFRLVTVVDVVLGPLLTLVVFDTRKPLRVLARDLAVIGVLQVSALLYGLHTVYLARPIYLVHEVDRVHVLLAADVSDQDLAAAAPEFRSLPLWGVRFIGVREPRDGAELLASVELALQGRDAAQRPDWWQVLNERHLELMRKRSVSLAGIRSRYPAVSDELDKVLAKAALSESQAIALPLVNRDKVWTLVLKRDSAEILGYLPVDPF